MPIQILIDDRERNPKLLDALLNHEAIAAQRTRLAYGDFVIEQKVTLERKTVDDFAVSLMQGRLFSQAQRLQALGGLRYLILEGNLNQTRHQVRPEALRGAMIALTLKFGLPILPTANEKETALTLLYIGRQLATIDKGTVATAHRKATRKRTVQRRLLQQIPHIGAARADILIEKYSSIRAIVNATQESLASIEGIGYHIAQSIEKAVEETQNCYRNER